MAIYLFTGSSADNLVVGTTQMDLVSGGGGTDIVVTGSGDDFVSAGSGTDYVFTGSGDDIARGGSGNDYIVGGAGDDILLGDAGDDRIFGGEGDDTIMGGTGDDTMSGGTGSDIFLFGTDSGNDTITDFDVDEDTIDLSMLPGPITFSDLTITTDEDGHAVITHSSLGGTITLQGVTPGDLTADQFNFPTTDGSDSDTSNVWEGTDDAELMSDDESATDIRAGGGDDIVFAGEGDDILRGEAGDDTLLGEEGDDVLIGGAGDDWLFGGSGADTFVFGAGTGDDVVFDFTDGEDRISIDTNGLTGITDFTNLNITADGSDAIIDLSTNGGGTIRLKNVDVTELDAADFNFYDSTTDPDGF